MKVLLINRPTHYRIGFFNELARQARAADIDLDLLLIHCGKDVSSRSSQLTADYRVLPDRHVLGIQHPLLEYNTGFAREITSDYDAVVIPTPEHPLSFLEFQRAVNRTRATTARPIFWWNPVTWKQPCLKAAYYAFKKQAVRKTIPDFAAIVTYCEAGKRDFVETFGADPERVFIAPNTLDIDDLNRKSRDAHSSGQTACLRERLGLDGKQVLVFVGQLSRGKGLESLLYALACLPETVHLVIVGDGPRRRALEALTQAQGLGERVQFAGRQVDATEAYINLADLAVLPGLGGLAINHALACSVPVITSRADGTAEDLIRDGENGCLLRDTGPEAIAHAVGAALEDPARLAQLKANAFPMLKARADLSRMAGAFIEAFRLSSAG